VRQGYWEFINVSHYCLGSSQLYQTCHSAYISLSLSLSLQSRHPTSLPREQKGQGNLAGMLAFVEVLLVGYYVNLPSSGFSGLELRGLQ